MSAELAARQPAVGRRASGLAREGIGSCHQPRLLPWALDFDQLEPLVATRSPMRSY